MLISRKLRKNINLSLSVTIIVKNDRFTGSVEHFLSRWKVWWALSNQDLQSSFRGWRHENIYFIHDVFKKFDIAKTFEISVVPVNYQMYLVWYNLLRLLLGYEGRFVSSVGVRFLANFCAYCGNLAELFQKFLIRVYKRRD